MGVCNVEGTQNFDGCIIAAVTTHKGNEDDYGGDEDYLKHSNMSYLILTPYMKLTCSVQYHEAFVLNH